LRFKQIGIVMGRKNAKQVDEKTARETFAHAADFKEIFRPCAVFFTTKIIAAGDDDDPGPDLTFAKVV